ncbi:hypothetical protein BDFB_011216 [Asbolus verrucosus]|uniref:Uncharacterized protein n=1 Tax=Asbolus verrucosus TaxID=1661398 RepID=A0A482W6Q4_ASBVE|nr:hypothetical protein BDFB_011216 [Asbolus verrucosus]
MPVRNGNPGSISASPEEIKCECLRLIQITTYSNPNNNIKYDSNLPHCGFGMIPSHRRLRRPRNPSATSAA